MDVKYRFNGFTVDPVRRLLFGPDDQPIALKPRVFDALLFMIEHRGDLLEKQVLLHAIWPHVVVEENNLNQVISTLRRIFGETRDDHRFIVTEPGRGYRFVARVETIPAELPVPMDTEPVGPQATSRERKPERSSNVWLAGSVGLAIAALLFAVWAGFRPVPGAGAGAKESLGPAVRVTRLTAYTGNELAPALSPSGESVVFSADIVAGNRDLYVMRIGSAGLARLTEAAEPDRFPAWSPDGTNIAFLRQTGPTSFKLIVVPAAGGRERDLRTVHLRPGDIYGSPPLTWTASSDGLVFTTRTGDDPASSHHLYALTLATGDVARITSGENVYDTSPAISADGRSLAFVRHTNFRSHSRGVLLVRPLQADAGEPLVVPAPNTDAVTLGDAVHSASWSADGRYLKFVAGANLYEWEYGATAARQVWAGAGHLGEVTAQGDISALSMVRDGEGARAVVASIERALDIVALRVDPGTHSASAAPVPRFVSTAVDSQPSFANDGKHVAFVSRRDGLPNVYVAAAAGGDAARLTDRQARALGHPRWSLDDKLISFHELVDPNERNLYVVDADTGAVRRVAHGCCATWSRNGEYLYATDIGAEHVLSRVRVADGDREPLFAGGFAVEAKDGSKLLYGKFDESRVYARDLAGDVRNNTEELLVTDSAYPPGVAPVADGFYYFGHALPGEVSTIRFYDFATGQSKTVTDVAGTPFESATVSPDATEVLFGLQAPAADLYLVEFGPP